MRNSETACAASPANTTAHAADFKFARAASKHETTAAHPHKTVSAVAAAIYALSR